ncbi:PREDICTED: basic salivary proline-rich protein 4-like [Chinchilla lanigera]|uniref:basic salivary proline-rich protein 4-like n=1 Tax=Chinchilla lanigera TaxID=34839 RepID=UPI00038F0835|nr:PREDICTED: basic salivary proline-rich protein 4-like [Chinchilla lanigera]
MEPRQAGPRRLEPGMKGTSASSLLSKPRAASSASPASPEIPGPTETRTPRAPPPLVPVQPESRQYPHWAREFCTGGRSEEARAREGRGVGGARTHRGRSQGLPPAGSPGSELPSRCLAKGAQRWPPWPLLSLLHRPRLDAPSRKQPPLSPAPNFLGSLSQQRPKVPGCRQASPRAGRKLPGSPGGGRHGQAHSAGGDGHTSPPIQPCCPCSPPAELSAGCSRQIFPCPCKKSYPAGTSEAGEI